MMTVILNSIQSVIFVTIMSALIGFGNGNTCCPESLIDNIGDCCDNSGSLIPILDSNGSCCPDDRISSDEQCCEQVPNPIFDANGSCCLDTFTSDNNECCEFSVFDGPNCCPSERITLPGSPVPSTTVTRLSMRRSYFFRPETFVKLPGHGLNALT